MSVDSTLEILLDHLDSIFKTNEVWQAFYEYTQALGADAMSYYHFPPPGAVDFDEKTFISLGYEANASADYSRQSQISNNPFENRTLAFDKPIFWSSIKKELGFCENQWNLLKSIYCENHFNGIAIPVHGPNNRNGVIVLRFEDSDRKYSQSEIRKLQTASQYAHSTFCRLRIKNRKKQTSLTSREQEILTWVAHGKSNAVIADIVGISRHTVNGYLRRIYLKTGTSDRTTASLRGIGEGLINY
ncbi:MAG: LuxR C-terminal-related transcriptional regulator [Maricaulaceae bacterium]